MPDATVIISTFNPRLDYLARVLAALKAQTLPPTQFVILLIDNASTPPVALPDATVIRILHEPRPGLRFARECDILAAQVEILFFVDENNVLVPFNLQMRLLLTPSSAEPEPCSFVIVSPVRTIQTASRADRRWSAVNDGPHPHNESVRWTP